MSVTIKDIARETGLSLSTISKYLNNKNIQEKNKVLIEEAIKKLGYRPNRIAQSLRSERTMTIAILQPDLGNYFWGDLVFGVTNFFAQLDYIVIECTYNHDIVQEKEVLNYLVAKKVDGVVFLPVNLEDTMYCLLQEAKIPVVVLDQYPALVEKFPVDTVRSDNISSGRKIAKYLISKGHRRIGIMSPADYSSTIAERISGFLEECRNFGGINISSSAPVQFMVTDDVVMGVAKKYFEKMMDVEEPPTAIYCTNYIVAMGVLLGAEDMGITISQDISIICYDDDPLFRVMASPITCVAQDLKKLAIESSKILLKRINGDWSDFPIARTVEVSFRERESVRNLADVQAEPGKIYGQ